MSTNVHGTALVLSGIGVLLRGPSGSGKSLLALALLDRWQGSGAMANLVADDRVDLQSNAEGLVMTAPAALAGRIELRGRGIIERPHIGVARLALIIDLVPDLVRMPEPDAFITELMGVTLARAPVPVAGVVPIEHQILLVSHAVAERNRQLSYP